MDTYVRLLFCRHTQTDLNVQKRYSGAREDVPLNAKGEEQADRLAETISVLRIAGVYSSDLLRARQVAEKVATKTGCSVQFDSRLREVDIGAIGTRLKEDVRVQYPEPRYRTSGPDYDFSDIGGESRQQVIERQLTCFREILERHGGDRAAASTVVIVGHGTALRTMLEHFAAESATLHAQGKFQSVLFSSHGIVTDDIGRTWDEIRDLLASAWNRLMTHEEVSKFMSLMDRHTADEWNAFAPIEKLIGT